MMQHFLSADAATGAIRQLSASSRSWAEIAASWPVADGEVLVPLATPLAGPQTAWRVVQGEVVPRAVMAPRVSAERIAADGEAECVISGLPVPCVVAIGGAVEAGPLDVTDGVLVLTSTVPGAILLRISAEPDYQPWEGVIHAD